MLSRITDMSKSIKATQIRPPTKMEQTSSYAEMTLIEDVIEANKHIGEHIDSLTRRSTLIQEHLAVLHPEVSIRTIRRILSKDVEKS
jgi:adenine deaminase